MKLKKHNVHECWIAEHIIITTMSYLILSPVSKNTLMPQDLSRSTALAASFFIGSLIVIILHNFPELFHCQ